MKLAVLVSLSVLGSCHSTSLRRALRARVMAGHASGKDASEPMFEVLTNTSISGKATQDCLCQLGQFWHWRIKECITQGSWGYECGFFPAEHHRFVCRDGLTCEKLENTKIQYQHEGAVPATCLPGAADGQGEAGHKRHEEECLTETVLSGEASSTVRVILMGAATAQVTKEHTATATANHSIKSEATGEAGDVKVTKKGVSEQTSSVEHTASATREAAAQAEGVGEGSAVVSIEEVKKALNLKEDQKVGPVLAAQVISKGDQMAFDQAYAAALEAAKANGDAAARAAAEKLAADKAAADAKLEAEAKAAQKAAWEAEAGAQAKSAYGQGDLQSEADAAAKAKADELANAAKAADAAAKAKADELANAATATEDAAAAAQSIPSEPVPEVKPAGPVGDLPVPRKVPEKDQKATLP